MLSMHISGPQNSILTTFISRHAYSCCVVNKQVVFPCRRALPCPKMFIRRPIKLRVPSGRQVLSGATRHLSHRLDPLADHLPTVGAVVWPKSTRYTILRTLLISVSKDVVRLALIRRRRHLVAQLARDRDLTKCARIQGQVREGFHLHHRPRPGRLETTIMRWDPFLAPDYHNQRHRKDRLCSPHPLNHRV